jgi:crotonobetainyl-CoA:carnitine CoA-transferase CaiB-like acyl-CoA transferase
MPTLKYHYCKYWHAIFHKLIFFHQSAGRTGPLAHIKVLDLSRVLAGPWAAQLLADLGAEVIKVEQPERGDDTRAWGPPFVQGRDGPTRESAYYLCANRGKQSITVDYRNKRGQEIVHALAKECHVLIENFKVGALAKYGLDYESIHRINPGTC